MHLRCRNPRRSRSPPLDRLFIHNLQKTIKLYYYIHTDKCSISLKKIAQKNKLEIITTEKDYLRIKDYGHKNLIVAKVKLIIENKDNFINEIMKINAKKN